MRRPALLVIDMLSDFFTRWDAGRRKQLVQSLNALVALMREHALPVVWVRQEFEPDLSDAFPEMRSKNIHINIKGTPGCLMLPELDVRPTDPVVIKKRYSPFFRTSLDEELSHLQPDCLILAGINTHACIRTAAIDAYQRDWPVILAADCIDSYDREHNDVSLRYMRDKIATLLTNEQIAAMLGEATPGQADA